MSKENKYKHLNVVFLFICLFFTGITGTLCAQETIPKKTTADTVIVSPDSAFILLDSVFEIITDQSAKIIQENAYLVNANNESSFKPNPKIAFRVALIFPGFGQIYNRQYWKLPIVYGGLMACAYAITWNNKTLQDYNRAYFDIKFDSENYPKAEDRDKWSSSWQSFVASSNDPAARLHDRTFHENLRRRKDYFRRYRDLSIIIGVAVYFICAADSYIDAQMFDFDLSPDLSFRVTPEFRPETITSSRSFGLNFCMNF